jgi:hypothetical protein
VTQSKEQRIPISHKLQARRREDFSIHFVGLDSSDLTCDITKKPWTKVLPAHTCKKLKENVKKLNLVIS